MTEVERGSTSELGVPFGLLCGVRHGLVAAACVGDSEREHGPDAGESSVIAGLLEQGERRPCEPVELVHVAAAEPPSALGGGDSSHGLRRPVAAGCGTHGRGIGQRSPAPRVADHVHVGEVELEVDVRTKRPCQLE